MVWPLVILVIVNNAQEVLALFASLDIAYQLMDLIACPFVKMFIAPIASDLISVVPAPPTTHLIPTESAKSIVPASALPTVLPVQPPLPVEDVPLVSPQSTEVLSVKLPVLPPTVNSVPPTVQYAKYVTMDTLSVLSMEPPLVLNPSAPFPTVLPVPPCPHAQLAKLASPSQLITPPVPVSVPQVTVSSVEEFLEDLALSATPTMFFNQVHAS